MATSKQIATMTAELERYVQEVVLNLSTTVQHEVACARVVQRLALVLQAYYDETTADIAAEALRSS